MSLRHTLLLSLLGLLAVCGVAAAQACPECDEDGEPDDSRYSSADSGVTGDEDGEPDDSRYSSVDSGVIGDEEGALVDTDQSVGENANGRFTWFQHCVQFWDMLGNSMSLMVEAFVSEDGVDTDAKATVNGHEVDLEETPLGELDDATWDAMEPVPVAAPVDHTALPEGVDVDRCIPMNPDEEREVSTEVTTTCEATI